MTYFTLMFVSLQFISVVSLIVCLVFEVWKKISFSLVASMLA